MKTMKKAISVLLLVCMVSALCSAGAYADTTAGTGGEGGTTPSLTIDLSQSSYATTEGVSATATLSGVTDTSGYSVKWTWSGEKNGEFTGTDKFEIAWQPNELPNGTKITATATKDAVTLTSNEATVNVADLTASIAQSGNTLTVSATKNGTSVTIPVDGVAWNVTENSDNISIGTATGNTATIVSNNIYVEQTGKVKATVTVDSETAVAETPVTIPASGVRVSGITISANPTTLTIGSNVTIYAQVSPDDATNRSVSWKIISDNADKFNITANGVISAKDAATFTSGETFTVQASHYNDNGTITSNDLTVSVVPATVEATGISISPNPATTLYVADGKNTVKLTATAAPEGSSLKDLTWSSDKENVASVDSNGLVTAKAVGTATITAKAKDSVTDKELTQTIDITVAPIQVEKIELSETASTMTVKDTKTVTATVLPVTASQKALTWKSSDASIVSVAVDSTDSSKVIITANKVGTADITATAVDGSNVSAKYTVTVTEPAAYRINLTPNTITLGQGNVNYFTATILDKDGKNVSGSDKSITWSFTGDTSDGIGITSNGYNSTNNNYTATVLGKFNRNYVVTASCSIGGVVYSSSASVTVSFTPAIVSGQNAVYNGRDAMSFVVNDSAQNFNGHVYVDGRELSNVYYSTSNYNGYLVVTLNQSFLNFLCQYYNNNGYHTLSVDTKYGAAASYFRTWGTASSFNGVKTGDDANLGLWAALLAVSAVGAGAAVIIVKRRKTNNG